MQENQNRTEKNKIKIKSSDLPFLGTLVNVYSVFLNFRLGCDNFLKDMDCSREKDVSLKIESKVCNFAERKAAGYKVRRERCAGLLLITWVSKGNENDLFELFNTWHC